MMIPMIMYWITGKEKWFKKCFMPMAITEDNITDDILQTAKLSIDYMKVKTAMPSNVDEDRMKKCDAPALVQRSTINWTFLMVKYPQLLPRIYRCHQDGISSDIQQVPR